MSFVILVFYLVIFSAREANSAERPGVHVGEGAIMNRKHFLVCGLVIVGLLVLPERAVKAGTVIDQDMVDIWGKKSGLVLSYSKKRLRIDQKDGRLSNIMDFRRNRIVILDHISRSYIEYSLSAWEKRVSQRMRSQRRDQKREIRVEPTGAEKEINGFKTRQIRVFIDGVLFQDNWVTQDVDLEEMLKTIKKGVGRLSGVSKAEMKEMEEIYHKTSEWGFPILTNEYRQFSGKTLREVTEVKRIETQDLADRLFTPPKGYRQRTQ